ncbi:MAG: CDP-alcohol phosphatidyltransferase family protein [Candidatus Aminicenantes bacterium]|nr:MAG: CDP-alcohol phosphatidyltransferase family protein [Candidatus Aminicenantes bacterium]
MNSETDEIARIFPKKLIAFVLSCLDSLASLFINLRIGPNALSALALVAGIAAGALFIFEQPLLAGIMIFICGIFDILDGKVAESMNKKSLFGAIFDSTLDRYSEFFIFLGIVAHFRNHWALWITLAAMLGSALVSYTRARAEGLGVVCRVGIMQRAERIVFLALGAVLGSLFKIFDPAMIVVLSMIAVISHITVMQRTLHVRKIENANKAGKEV